MKLSIKEKAKAYDEALKIARQYWNDRAMPIGTNFKLERMFPELKESESEKIRKALILYYQGDGCLCNNKYRIDYKDIRAWLEKQGIQNPSDNVEPKFKVGDWVVNAITKKVEQVIEVTDYEYICSGHLIVSFDEQHLLKKWTIQDAKDGDVLVFGEQLFLFKRMNTSNSFYAHCNYHFIGYGCLSVYDGSYSIDNICPATKEQRDILMKAMADAGYKFDFQKKELKKIEQNPTDKVEPKFKLGDWLVHNERKHIIKVVNPTPMVYKVVDALGYHHTIPDTAIENNYHLWTIQDAKDGDVLATENFIFIFKNIDNGNGVHYYCHYEISKHEDDNQFGVALPQSLMGRVGNSLSHYSLATKEQRDTLMKAMTNARYTFDFEKKELKKIEQKLVEWSEEDSNIWNRTLLYLENMKDSCATSCVPHINECIIWLKSLKDRVQP